MMYLPEKTIATLEFDKIRQMLADLARTEGARAAALSLMEACDRFLSAVKGNANLALSLAAFEITVGDIVRR